MEKKEELIRLHYIFWQCCLCYVIIVGDTISSTGMDDMRRKTCFSDFRIYDRRRMLLYFECEKIHAASFSICHNFRNTINLIMGSSVFYPFHQNVLWTFLLGVLSIQIIEKAKKKQKKWISFFVVCLVLLMDFLLGTITMVDYNAAGILTVLLFIFFARKPGFLLRHSLSDCII